MKRVALLTLVVAATPCLAQRDSTLGFERNVCWRGQRAPKCRAFLITEIGYDKIWATTHTAGYYNFSPAPSSTFARDDFESNFIWTIGPMYNTAARRAVGATVSASPAMGRTRVAIEARRRTWGLESGALDLTAGWVREPVPAAQNAGATGYGLTSSALLGEGDIVNVHGRLDLILFGAGRVRAGTSAGIGAGSYAAVAVTILGIALLAAALSSLD